MGAAASLIFITVGAVLAFAVHADPDGLDLTTMGMIIMLVGAVHLGWTVYRERWRHRVVEESIEQGNGIPPIPLDDTVLVDPVAPIEAPTRTHPHQEHVG